jgi:DNA-binding response OmpR family regulator
MSSILLIEDDESLGPALKKSLETEGYSVKLCQTLKSAKEEEIKSYSLVLLDWMLPDGQGIDLLKEIGHIVPTIMLTARADLIDKIIGLEGGASDYINKPFEPRELLARIRVQLRKPTQTLSESERLTSKNIELIISERKATYNEEEINLTKMEFDLIYLLASTPKQVFSREKLLDDVWGYENYPTTRTVDTHVLQLRQKFSNDIIETVRGVGYKFNPDHS